MDYLSINYGHDETMLVGHAAERNGKIMLEFMPAANLRVDDINRINGQIVPTYLITKQRDGFVEECEIVGFAVVPKPKDAL